MDYEVLARKWRPKSFSEIVGQKHVVIPLTKGITLKRIHHAWLFSGTRGVGKTSIARLLAKSLNCETGITVTPCNMCNNCQEMERGNFIDFIEIDAASRTKVEDVRDFLDNIQYVPIRGRFKVYLIDEVHMLSLHSFNALLKTLEEPFKHVKFLLATTNEKKIPDTVLSRCLRFHLKMLDTEEIYFQLKYILTEEKIKYDVYALKLLARAADGSLRDALNLTEQAIVNGDGNLTVVSVNDMLGLLDSDQAISLIEAIDDADSELVMKLINHVATQGIEWDMLLMEMQSLLHRIAMVQLFSDTFVSTERGIEQKIYRLAKKISPTNVQFYYKILLIGRKELSFAPDHRMGVEMTLLRALTFHPKKSFQNSERMIKLSLSTEIID